MFITKHCHRLPAGVRAVVGACAVLITGAVLGGAEGEKLAMGKSVDYSHAGIALAVPGNFKHQDLSEPYDVMRAVLAQDDKFLQAVTVSAFPIAEKVTAESFADAMTEELKKNLTIRHLKVVKKVAIPIAGRTGSAYRMTYTYRGIRTSAARVYFVRELSPPNLRVCYVLTVESDESRKASLLRVLGAVMKTLKLTAIRHPSEIKVDVLRKPYKDHKLGFAIAPPKGWYVRPLDDGVVLAQTDYLAGGIPMPTVRVIVAPAPAGATSTAQADKCLVMAKKAFPGSKVVRKADIVLAGLKGRQFVLTHAPPVAGSTQPAPKGPGSLTVIQNVLCPPPAAGGDKKSRSIPSTRHTADTARDADTDWRQAVSEFL